MIVLAALQQRASSMGFTTAKVTKSRNSDTGRQEPWASSGSSIQHKALLAPTTSAVASPHRGLGLEAKGAAPCARWRAYLPHTWCEVGGRAARGSNGACTVFVRAACGRALARYPAVGEEFSAGMSGVRWGAFWP